MFYGCSEGSHTFAGLNDLICFISIAKEVSRFAEIAVLHLSENLRDICGRISSRLLSEETHYASYLLYRTVPLPIYNGYFVPLVKGVCRFVEYESREEAQ